MRIANDYDKDKDEDDGDKDKNEDDGVKDKDDGYGEKDDDDDDGDDKEYLFVDLETDLATLFVNARDVVV